MADLSPYEQSPGFSSLSIWPSSPSNSQGDLSLYIGPQDWDAQSVAQPAHCPEWVSAHVISLFLPGAQVPTWSLFFPSCPITCIPFLQPWLYKGSSASFWLVFSKDYSTRWCICDTFVWGGELHIFLLYHLDLHLYIFWIIVFSLPDVSFANIFSQCLACLLIILILSFAEQKILFSMSPIYQLFLSWIMSRVVS